MPIQARRRDLCQVMSRIWTMKQKVCLTLFSEMGCCIEHRHLIQARESRWCDKKTRDQVVYLDHKISKSSVKDILIENGYDPEPDLIVRSTWHEFLKSHWDVLAACDFFTLELLVYIFCGNS